MTALSVHIELLHGVTTGPLGGWSLPSALVLGGVLAAVLIGGAFGTPRSALIGETIVIAVSIVIFVATLSSIVGFASQIAAAMMFHLVPTPFWLCKS